MMFRFLEHVEELEESVDYILRCVVEEHIEKCDFKNCDCLQFYVVTNSKHRLELARLQYAADLPDEDHHGVGDSQRE